MGLFDLFKSRQQREFEAELAMRRSKAHVQRFIRQAKKVQNRYWELGKEALRLGDREQFRRLGAAFLRARELVNQWERYLLQLETLSVHHQEVSATGQFLKGINALSRSILRGATPDQIAATQAKMEEAMARTEALNEVLALAMESSADAVFGAVDVDEKQIDQLALQMDAEAAADETSAYDQRIAQALQEIEQQMRKEMK